jgi:DNA-binding response OmpR family regulator
MRIGLLVESATILEFLSTALGLAGHTVCTCASEDALLASLFLDSQVHTPLPYDLLILDVILPETPSDLELLTLLDRAVAGLPLIVMTSSSSHLVKRAEHTFPHVAFLLRPFHMDVLTHLIEAQTHRVVQAL